MPLSVSLLMLTHYSWNQITQRQHPIILFLVPPLNVQPSMRIPSVPGRGFVSTSPASRRVILWNELCSIAGPFTAIVP